MLQTSYSYEQHFNKYSFVEILLFLFVQDFVSAKRTPIGKFGKSLAKIKATELGAAAIKGVIQHSGIDKDLIEEVIMGNLC